MGKAGWLESTEDGGRRRWTDAATGAVIAAKGARAARFGLGEPRDFCDFPAAAVFSS